MLFAVGTLLLLVGLATTAFNYLRYSEAASVVPSEDHFREAMDTIDDSTPEEVWEMWRLVNNLGLGDYEASYFTNARRYADYFRNFLISGVVMTVCGAVLATAALVMPARKNES